jgi:hypothetical protein
MKKSQNDAWIRHDILIFLCVFRLLLLIQFGYWPFPREYSMIWIDLEWSDGVHIDKEVHPLKHSKLHNVRNPHIQSYIYSMCLLPVNIGTYHLILLNTQIPILKAPRFVPYQPYYLVETDVEWLDTKPRNTTWHDTNRHRHTRGNWAGHFARMLEVQSCFGCFFNSVLGCTAAPSTSRVNIECFFFPLLRSLKSKSWLKHTESADCKEPGFNPIGRLALLLSRVGWWNET